MLKQKRILNRHSYKSLEKYAVSNSTTDIWKAIGNGDVNGHFARDLTPVRGNNTNSYCEELGYTERYCVQKNQGVQFSANI